MKENLFQRADRAAILAVHFTLHVTSRCKVLFSNVNDRKQSCKLRHTIDINSFRT